MSSLVGRCLGVCGLAGLALLAAAYWLTREPAPRIRVLWREGISAPQQAALEATYRLRNARDRLPEGSLAYDLLDTSRSNIRRLVEDPAVADTNDLDRNAYIVEPDTDRGGEWTWLAHRVPGLRGAWSRRGVVLLLATAALIGLRREWATLLRQTEGGVRHLVHAGRAQWRAQVAARAGTPLSSLQVAPGGSRAASALLLGGGIAAALVLVGTGDLESFETAFFSLDRDAAATVVRVLGQPVYTTSVGLGVRLPLHGSLGASPAAALAWLVPGPLTYGLLMAFAIAASTMVVRHAVEPIAGRLVSWLAALLLFWSLPIVNYTIFDDWPETAVTYCTVVACVFAPQALVASLGARSASTARRIAVLSIAASVWSLIALSHPGYWPLLAGTLVLASALAVVRPGETLGSKRTAIVVLGVVSLLPVALQAPDILREFTAGSPPDAPPMQRFVFGPEGALLPANAFPFVRVVEPRAPFTFLPLALVSLCIGSGSNRPQLRRLAVGSALISMALGVGAATLSPGTSRYAPSNTYALRDPAIAFAVLGGAAAIASIRTSATGLTAAGSRVAAAALVVTTLQGLALAGHLLVGEWLLRGPREPWTQNMRSGEDRARMRGLPTDRLEPGRLALWPSVRAQMRDALRASTDLAAAGFPLVTALTKDRTMRGLVGPNELLFNQTTDLSAEILCDGTAVRFLQLRYIVAPPDVECQSWRHIPDLQVDGRLGVGIARELDDRAWALPLARVGEPPALRPALSADSSLLRDLVPLAGTSVALTPGGAAVRLDAPSRADGYALVLPLAYDPALRSSSGEVRRVGGLAAVTGIDRGDVTVAFVPDLVALLRAASMTLAQLLAVVGFVGMASVTWRRGG